MKRSFNFLILFILFILVIANALIIVRGIKLSGEIYHFESQILGIKKLNTELEKKLYNASSLQFAASQAAKLGYTKNAQAYSLSVLKQAYNR